MGVRWRGDQRASIAFNSVRESTSRDTKARKSGSILGSTTAASNTRCYRVYVRGYRIVSIGRNI